MMCQTFLKAETSGLQAGHMIADVHEAQSTRHGFSTKLIHGAFFLHNTWGISKYSWSLVPLAS